MSSVLRIRRRITGAAGAPGSLKNAELAYNEIENVLYYGKGDTGDGTASSIIQIAGSGAYATTSYVSTNYAALGTSNSFAAGFTNTFAGTLNISGTFQLLGTTVTASAAELNRLAGVTIGTAAAGKALVLDNSRDISNINQLTATSLQNATSSPTFTVSSTGAVVGASLTSATINVGSGAFQASSSSATFTTSLQSASFSTSGSGNITAGGDLIATGNAYASTNKKLATEEYVNSVQQGLDVKQSVRAATTANITLSGLQTIDGVSLSAGDRVLVKNQSNAVNNGIYVVAVGAWTRATDANVTANVTAGLFTFVAEGTQNSDSGWILTSDDAITLGTSTLTFVQFSGAGMITIDGASTASVTNGLEKDGNYLRLDVRLKRIANLTGVTANKLIYVNGTDTFDVTDFTATARTLLGGADAAAMRTTLGLGSMATQSSLNVSITGGSIESVTLDKVTLDGGVF
jgi:hypothetical protein